MKVVKLKEEGESLGLFIKLNKGFARIQKGIENPKFDEEIEVEIDSYGNIKEKNIPSYIN